MLQVDASGERCLGDFSFDFYWQHQGSRLDPETAVSGVSYRHMVEALRRGDTVRISGDAGSRLASSLGVDLMRLGGRGGPIEGTGRIILDGNAGSHMGISMLRGAIYVSGRVEPPLGNVIETGSDITGYRKFVSITEALERAIPVLEPNHLGERKLVLSDGLLRDTVGARSTSCSTIRMEKDAGMSTGILMQAGLIEVLGCAGRNTGVLLRGGRIVVRENTGDFTGAEMRGGEIFVGGNAGSFACARMRGGAVFAREGKPLPPARVHLLDSKEQSMLASALRQSPLYAMLYRKFSL